MDITDHVERASLVPQVAEQRCPADAGGGDLGLGPQDVHPAETFLLQPAQAPPELISLAPDHVRPELTVSAVGVPASTDLLGQVEHDRDREHVVLPG